MRSFIFFRRMLASVAFAAAALFFFAGALEAFDRFGGSSPAFALQALRSEALGQRSSQEIEALALLREVADETGMAALRWTRVGLADGLSSVDAAAQFNPTTFRISISPSAAARPASSRRALYLHEIGHALAFAYGARPLPMFASAQANEIMSSSLLANQIFHESFADAFFVAWSLRRDPGDPAALAALGAAVGSPVSRSSPAHETSPALRMLRTRLAEARQASASDLPRLLAEVASQGAALAIADLGAEREAACNMGARAIARFALDLGYEAFYLPWEMAQTFPISPSDPMAEGLAEIAALRSEIRAPNPWVAALSRARPAVEQALAASRSGASPLQASKMAGSGLSMMWQDALPNELDAASIAARLASASRSGWRARAASSALWLADGFMPTPTYGCSAQAAQRILGLAP